MSLSKNDIEKLSCAKLLCVGDIMLDQFVYGSASRISPEAPVPVFLTSDTDTMLGGAGNVVRNLSALGAKTSFFGVVGADTAGQQIRDLLEELKNVSATVLVDEARSSTIKERFISGTQQLLRVDKESFHPLNEHSEAELIAAIKGALSDCSALVLSDYDKGTLSRKSLIELISYAIENKVLVSVDPKGEDYSCYQGANWITPNSTELSLATGMPVESEDQVIAAARYLQTTFNIENVLVTRGGDGMTLVETSGSKHFPAEAKEVFDVSGAGDTVIACIAAALAAHISIDKAITLANIAAGIVVSKVGTAVVWPEDIVHALSQKKSRVEAHGKILTLNQAVERLKSWRNKGERICFTNGCFDLIHPGHISMLEKSRDLADRLVVGLNSDASVKRLKGSSRPIQEQNARSKVLASLSSVDLVIVFDGDTPIELIKAMKPEVLTKGADYARDQVVGAEILKDYNGEVRLIELVEGQSTTSTVQKMLKN